MVEETIGERAAETPMEKDEQERHFNTLVAGCSTLPSIWPFRWPVMEIVAGVHRGDGQDSSEPRRSGRELADGWLETSQQIKEEIRTPRRKQIESALGPSQEIVLKFLVPFARWKESFGLQKIGERRAGEVVQVARNIEMEPLGTEDTRLKTASVGNRDDLSAVGR